MAPLVMAGLTIASKFLPSLIGKITGDKGEDVARTVIDTAKKVTGISSDDPNDLVKALEKDPQILLQYQKQMADYELALAKEETERFKAQVENAGKQVDAYKEELKNGKWYQKAWRPLNGFLFPMAILLDYVGAQILQNYFNYKIAVAKITGEQAVDFSVEWSHIPEWVYVFWLMVLGIAVGSRGVEKVKATKDLGGKMDVMKTFASGILGK